MEKITSTSSMNQGKKRRRQLLRSLTPEGTVPLSSPGNIAPFKDAIAVELVPTPKHHQVVSVTDIDLVVANDADLMLPRRPRYCTCLTIHWPGIINGSSNIDNS